MWLASASRASDPMIRAVVSSTTKKVARIVEAATIRLTRASALP